MPYFDRKGEPVLLNASETSEALRTMNPRRRGERMPLVEVRVVRVTPFRFGGPEAGETAKILRRALPA
jgi:hypothetical protein